MPTRLKEHAEFAVERLQRMPLLISKTMSRYQLALADRQCRMAALSSQVQDLLTILCTSLYASTSAEEVVEDAAHVACQELTNRMSGRLPGDRYFRDVTRLGEAIAAGGFESIAGVDPGEILMPYEA